MSMKITVDFAVSVMGDGTSLTLAIDLSKAPVAIFPPGVQAGGNPPQEMSRLFSLTALVPTSVVNLGGSAGVASASLVGHILTLTWTSALSNGLVRIVTGTFVF